LETKNTLKGIDRLLANQRLLKTPAGIRTLIQEFDGQSAAVKAKIAWVIRRNGFRILHDDLRDPVCKTLLELFMMCLDDRRGDE
jgi:hypothetical protein